MYTLKAQFNKKQVYTLNSGYPFTVELSTALTARLIILIAR